MECPYCLEDFNEEALVCKGCGRDLRLVRPVINENLRLLAQVVALEDQVHKARSDVARATNSVNKPRPASRARRHLWRFGRLTARSTFWRQSFCLLRRIF